MSCRDNARAAIRKPAARLLRGRGCMRMHSVPFPAVLALLLLPGCGWGERRPLPPRGERTTLVRASIAAGVRTPLHLLQHFVYVALLAPLRF